MNEVARFSAFVRLCEDIGASPDKITPGRGNLLQRMEILFRTLSPRERETIRLLYGLDGFTYKVVEVGRIFTIIPEEVHLLKQNALEKLRRAVRPNLPAS